MSSPTAFADAPLRLLAESTLSPERFIAGHSGIQLLDDEEMLALPDPEWDVPGIIPRNGLVQMFGPYGSGKSFIALDYAEHRQLGLAWHGLDVKPGPVFYIAAEGATGMRLRIKGWREYTSTGKSGLTFIPEAVHLNDERQVSELIAKIRQRLPESAEPTIIVDTRSRCLRGNENSAEDMGSFVRGCDRLRNELSATVWVLHHPGWGNDDRGRGAYDFDASCDTIIRVEKDADRITLTCKKQKDGPDFGPLAFEALAVAGTLVIRPVEWNSGKLEGKRLQILRLLHQNSTAPDGLKYAAWRDHAKNAGVPESTFNKARDWLSANSYVQLRDAKWCLTDAGRMAFRSL